MKTKTLKYDVYYLIRTKRGDEWLEVMDGYDKDSWESAFAYVVEHEDSEYPFVIVAVKTEEVVYFDNA